MSETIIQRREAPAGHFAQVFLRGSGEGDLFTGFTLLTPEPLTDEEVITRWAASEIILESELSRGGGYTFPDLHITWLVEECNADRVVCEPNGWDEREEEYNTLLRVVRPGYEPGVNSEGYTPVHSDEERESRS